MSKERGLPLDARRKPANDLPLSPGDPGRLRRDPVGASAVRSAVAPPEPPRSLQIDQVSDVPAADEAADLAQGDLGHERSRELVLAKIALPGAPRDESGEATELDGSADSATVYRNSLNHKGLDQDGSDRDGANDGEWVESDAGEEARSAPDARGHSLKNLRLRLQLRRADVFLGLAVIVAAVALLWPTPGERNPGPTAWERVLIATGIAEEPQQTVHFHGDPDLKVWVDTHTALYYCPGDELYGKSPDGHYTTQREAQADRFEPAERSVCIQ